MSVHSGNDPVRIVLVDDNNQIHSLLKRFFAATDDVAVVGEASDGRQAIELVGRMRPDVVVMDTDMPVMDGLEATLAIRTQHPETRVISFTASPKEAPAGTYTTVIAKTEDISVLVDEIRRIRSRS